MFISITYACEGGLAGENDIEHMVLVGVRLKLREEAVQLLDVVGVHPFGLEDGLVASTSRIVAR